MMLKLNTKDMHGDEIAHNDIPGADIVPEQSDRLEVWTETDKAK